MADSKSVVIKLTNEQREAIKRATGKDITELRVDALEGRFSPMVVEQRKAPFLDGGAADSSRKAPFDSGARDSERKAPLDIGTPDSQRKAPLDIGTPDSQRKAPLVADDN